MVYGNLPNSKKINRPKSFYFRYLELCRSKNYPPLSEIKAAKCNENQNLEIFGDKLKFDDWLMINESLFNDQILNHISIRLKKNYGNVIEYVDNEKKARAYKNKPVIFTKYIFMSFLEALSNCITNNKNLTTLTLEGLPLNFKYVQFIANALSSNNSIQSVSFARSLIGDTGCEVLCNIIKCTPNIEKVNMSQCQLTVEGAGYIADMIKFQKIYRYSEGWKQSLRYHEVNPDLLQGLKAIMIAQNPGIRDEGIKLITEILKEDVWIKVVDVEDCNLTDVDAHHILDCLQINKSIVEFKIKGNSEINETLVKVINTQLGKDNSQNEEVCVQLTKVNTIAKLREKLKLLEEQLKTEKSLRRQVDILNEQLHEQLRAYEQNFAEQEKMKIPDGFTLVDQNYLDDLIAKNKNLELTLLTLRHHKRPKVKKAKSEIAPKMIKHKIHKYSRSEHVFIQQAKKYMESERIYFETDIGDTKCARRSPKKIKCDLTEVLEGKKQIMRHYPSKENVNSSTSTDESETPEKLNEYETNIEQLKMNARAIFLGC